MSARLSTLRPRAASGLMYAAVPRITPATVPSEVMVGDIEGSGVEEPPSLAGDQLHREEAMALVLMEAVDRCDVRMVEGGQDLGLPLEASESLGTLGERRREEFQRNLPVELGVSGAPDFAHASRPQGAENLERAEAGGRSEGHFGTDSIPPI